MKIQDSCLVFLWINWYYSKRKSSNSVVIISVATQLMDSTPCNLCDIWQLPFPVRFHSVSFFMHKNSIDCSPFYPLHNLFDPYSSLWVKTKSFMLRSAADKTENSSSGIRSCFLYYGKLSFKRAFSHRMANVIFFSILYGFCFAMWIPSSSVSFDKR